MENKVVLEYESIRKELSTLKISSIPKYDISSAIAIQIWKSLTYSRVELVKRLIGLLITEKVEIVDQIDLKSNFTALYYTEPISPRLDNKQIMDNGVSFIEPCNHCNMFLIRRPSFKVFLDKLPVFLEAYKKIKSNCVIKRMYYAASVATVTEVVKKISNSKIARQTKCLLTFQDHEMMQNIFVQFVQINGGCAITLQHGQRVYRKQDADYMAFDNFISNYTLLWNRFSRIQYQNAGHDQSRLPIVGSTKYSNANTRNVEGDELVDWNEIIKRKTIGIVLNVPTQFDAMKMNSQLIEWGTKFADKHGYKVIIKLHPIDESNKYNLYISDNVSIVDAKMPMVDFAQRISFGIGHASGALVDLVIKHIPIFQFINEIAFPFELPESMKFSNYEDMDRNIERCIADFCSDNSNFDEIRGLYFEADATNKHLTFFKKMRSVYGEH